MKLIAQKVFKIGKQSLLYDEDNDQYYVTIKNRTYSSMQPIPKDKASIWKERLR